MSSTYASILSSYRRDTPTDVSVQTRELMDSIIYDESMLTDEDDGAYQQNIDQDIDDDTDDEENKPTYLQRNKQKDSAKPSDRQQQLTLALVRGNSTYNSPRKEEKKWHPKKPDYNRWRRQNMDVEYGTFYSYKPETIASPDELPVEPSSHREPAEGHLFGGVDFFHMREKSYIKRVSQTLRSPYPGKSEQRRFSQHIMQEYKRPLKEVKSNGYGAPKPVVLNQTFNDVNDVVEAFLKPNNGYNVMPKRQTAEKCDRPNQLACEFCDVLGPGSCAMCIEATNRRIAHDVEQAAFPALDCSASSLVAPKLSDVMASYGRTSKARLHHQHPIGKEPLQKGRTTFALPPIASQKSPDVTSFKKIKADTNVNQQLSSILKKGKATNVVLPAIHTRGSPRKQKLASLSSLTAKKTVKPYWTLVEPSMQGV